MKKFFEEFKTFISKGDVVSMAVGLMVGSAFTAIITALNTCIITPVLGVFTGGMEFSHLIIPVGSGILVGDFIEAIINFFITALVLFLVVKLFNSFKKKEEEKPAPEPVTPEDVKLLTEIRDLLKDQK